MKTRQKTGRGRALLTALLVLVLCVAFAFAVGAADGDVAIDAANFPDANFRTYIQKKIDSDGDNVLSAEERDAVISIDVADMQIADLTGVNYFTRLQTLTCINNLLTKLDVSGCTSLATLWCYDNSLTELVLPQSASLREINCSYNRLTHLDVSSATELLYLYCQGNMLTHIDLSQNSQFSMLVSEQSFNITVISLDGTTWTYEMPEGFDAGKVSGLTGGTFSGNVLTLNTDAPEIYSTVVTYTYDTGLTEQSMSVILTVETAHLHDAQGMCSCGAGVRLNEQNFPDAVFRTYVAGFDTVADGFLTVEELAAVTSIDVGGRGISDLTGVEYFTELTVLACNDNNLTSLDVSALTELMILYCENNRLTELDTRKNYELQYLFCQNNSLVALDLSNNTLLETVDCSPQTITVTVSEAARIDMTKINPLFDASKVTDEYMSNIMLDGNEFIIFTNESVPHRYYYYLIGFTKAEDATMDVKVIVDNHHEHSQGANNTCACGAVYQTAFNDRNFVLYLADNYFGGSFGNYITPMQVATVTSIDLSGVEVTDLTGIEHFKNLTSFTMRDETLECDVRSLDLSGLTKLETVDVGYAFMLSALDLTGCTSLKSLDVSNCYLLNTLDISSLTALESLDVSFTQISSLNLSANTALTTLNIAHTAITSLDLSGMSGDVALTGQSAVTIIACGTGYVDMAQFGDAAKITYATNGVLGADGWLKLNEGATSFQYGYATGNGETELIVNVAVIVSGSHTYTTQNVPKDEAQHYTEACSVCRAVVEDSEEGHTYGADHVCTVCTHHCTHGANTGANYDTGVCEFCGKQFALCVSSNVKLYYDTLAEALANLATNSTIRLYTDMTADQALAFAGTDTFTNITLDLNGKTLTFGEGLSGAYLTLDGIVLYINDTSEAKTGKITNVAGNNDLGIELINGARVEFCDITIEFAGSYAFTISGGSMVTQTGGTVKNQIYICGGQYRITNGTIDVETSCAFYVNPAPEGIINNVCVMGGTVSVNDTAGNGGLLDESLNHVDIFLISGGTLINKAGTPFGVYLNGDSDNIIVIGGTFENGVRANEELGLSALLSAGCVFYDEAGNFMQLDPGQYEIDQKVSVGQCPEHIGGTPYCKQPAICDRCGTTYGEPAPGVHTGGDDDGACDICGEYTFTGAGTEGDSYIVTSVGELIAAAHSTANEKNYVKLGADINGGAYTSIDFETTQFELDLNGYRLYVDEAVQIKDDVIGTIKNGILDAHVSVLSENAHLYIDGVTGMGNILSCNGGCFTITDSSFTAIYISGDDGVVTATNVTITPTSGGIFNIISNGMNNNNATLVLEGVTYTASLADTHWPHTGAQDKLMPNGDGTHNICWSCCETVIDENVACTDPDSDCTTASTCTCGYTLSAQAAHTLAIKADKNDTHHTLKCTVSGCNYEEDAEHTYKEIVRNDYEVSAATCTQKAVYYKSCDCGHKGTETFEGGSLNPNNHTSASDSCVPNNDGTHNLVRVCCGAIVDYNYSCSIASTDGNCLTAEACTKCGYTPIPAQAQHNYVYNAGADYHMLVCNNHDCSVSEALEPHVDTDNDNYCNICNHWINVFEDMSISLGQDIKVHYYIGANYVENPEIRFTINDYTKTVKGVLVGDQYKFTFDGVAPHWMCDNIAAELIVGGTVVQTYVDDVRGYLVDLKSMTASELGMSEDKYNAMITLVNDLLVYGGAAQTYKEHNTGKLASKNITGSTFTDVTASDTTVQNGKVTFTGATVFFDSVNRLKFKFTASDLGGVTFKLRVNGGEEAEIGYVSNGDGTYTIMTGAIYAYCFDDVYTVTAYVGGEADAVLTYSVKSYVFAKQGDAGNIAALVKATYNYGLSAKAYKEFN